MIGKTISHYRILEKLGEGGMGVVYKAEDLNLGRPVALKFLPAELTRDPRARERFINEARTASALDHPNVCTIYEVGQTDDGVTFMAMAYYDGENLKDKIERGPVNVDEAVSIALQIAQGLAKAHNSGIVHRDIKPANIILTRDNTARILDFGLAKLKGTKLTRTGTTLGTARYMSPEQATGRDVDRRSDIWSLGIILYEMITARHAFPGDYEQATLYAIINTEPEPVTALRSGIPLDLERIVNKCLRKDPAERYQSAEDLIADLLRLQRTIRDGTRTALSAGAPQAQRRTRRWIWAVPIAALAVAVIAVFARLPSRQEAVPRDSVAVLPFVDMSPQRDQGYFCDGMTEAIIGRLSNIRRLKVPARTSVFVFKGKDRDIREIGRKLQVRTVLEGSVQKSGDRLRITAQLINAADGYHMWSETYDRGLQDVFAVQDEISSAVANALDLEITSDERRRLSETPIDNVAAYECYLKAYDKIWQFNESSLDSAKQYLQDGVAIVGDNPLLFSALALVYWQYANIGVGQEDDITQAQKYAEKALALDPSFSTAQEVLGSIYKDFLGNTREGISHYKKALAANPNEVNALRKLAYAYIVIVGRPAEAAPLTARARQIDPLEPFKFVSDAVLNIYAGKYAKAVESGAAFYQADTTNPLAQFVYAWTLICNDKRAEAFSIVDKAAAKTPDNVCTKFGLLLKYALLKDRDSVFAEMTPEFQKTCRRDPEWSYYVALALSLLGAKSEALDWLENAVSRGFINYPALKREPFLSNLRGEKRFAELSARVKREWVEFGKWDKKSPVGDLRDY